ncbi:hypothetical protein LTS17_000200 [Exophiala oligosperma]
MGDNDTAKIWVPVTVGCSILVFFLVFHCLSGGNDKNKSAFDDIPPADLLRGRRRGRPGGFRVRQPPRHSPPRGMPLEEFVMAREEPRRPGSPEWQRGREREREHLRRPEPIYLFREPRRGFRPMFVDPEDPDPWLFDHRRRQRQPMFPPQARVRRGGPQPRIIEREPMFL